MESSSNGDLKRKFTEMARSVGLQTLQNTSYMDHVKLEKDIISAMTVAVNNPCDLPDIKKRTKHCGVLLFELKESCNVMETLVEKVRHYTSWYNTTMKPKLQEQFAAGPQVRFTFFPWSTFMKIRCFLKLDNGYVPNFCDSDYVGKKVDNVDDD